MVLFPLFGFITFSKLWVIRVTIVESFSLLLGKFLSMFWVLGQCFIAFSTFLRTFRSIDRIISISFVIGQFPFCCLLCCSSVCGVLSIFQTLIVFLSPESTAKSSSLSPESSTYTSVPWIAISTGATHPDGTMKKRRILGEIVSNSPLPVSGRARVSLSPRLQR